MKEPIVPARMAAPAPTGLIPARIMTGISEAPTAAAQPAALGIAGRDQKNAEFLKRLGQKTDQMEVAFGQRNNKGKTHGAADCLHQSSISHHLGELIQTVKRFQCGTAEKEART